MKHFKEFITEEDSSTDAPTNQTTGVENPDAPLLNKDGKDDFILTHGTIVGNKYVEVDNETYHNCCRGKVPFQRWSSYIKDDNLRIGVKALYNKHKTLMVKNKETGAHSFIK